MVVVLCHDPLSVELQFINWYNSEIIAPSVIECRLVQTQQSRPKLSYCHHHVSQMRGGFYVWMLCLLITKQNASHSSQKVRLWSHPWTDYLSTWLLAYPRGLKQTIDSSNVIFGEKCLFSFQLCHVYQLMFGVLLMLDSWTLTVATARDCSYSPRCYPGVPCGLPNYYTPALDVIFVVQPLLGRVRVVLSSICTQSTW